MVVEREVDWVLVYKEVEEVAGRVPVTVEGEAVNEAGTERGETVVGVERLMR